METFASTDNNHIVYYDFPFYKKTNKNGSMVEFTNSDALAQAVKIWLVSKKNEKIRSKSGGIIYSLIGKMMDDNQASIIRNRIIEGLEKEFVPSLTPIEVNVIPNYDKARWEISIVAYNASLAVGVNTNVIITNSI